MTTKELHPRTGNGSQKTTSHIIYRINRVTKQIIFFVLEEFKATKILSNLYGVDFIYSRGLMSGMFDLNTK